MSRLLSAAALCCLIPTACGPLEPLPKRMPPPPRQAHAETAIGCWDGGQDLAGRKKVVVDTLRAQGADDWRVAVTLAVALIETNTLSARDRDASKDFQGDAKNFSAFNMNAYALRLIGWTEGCGPDLNDDAHLAEATRLFSKGMDQLGEQKFLFLHRGGQTAMDDGCSYGCREYESTIKALASHLLQDKTRLTDCNRYACDVPHV